jgi:hypothetical protein
MGVWDLGEWVRVSGMLAAYVDWHCVIARVWVII